MTKVHFLKYIATNFYMNEFPYLIRKYLMSRVHCLVNLTCRNQWQWGSALDNLSCFSSTLKNKQVLQMNSTVHKVTILKYVPHKNVHKTAQAQTRTTGHVHYNLIKYTCECHMLYGTIMNSNWPIIVCATHWTFHKSK